MNTINVKKFVWAFFVLAITTTSVFAQGWRNGNRMNRIQNSSCINQITGITENQKTKIQELETKHQQEMDKLRTKQRSTFDPTEKNKLFAEMDKKVTDHRNMVKTLLTEEQQTEYDQFHSYGYSMFIRQQQFAGRGRGNMQSFNRRRGNGRGKGRFADRGYGRRYQFQSDSLNNVQER